MIPLGSCTMKLNATSEMIPITWPEFRRRCIHLRHPSNSEGYAELRPASCATCAVPGDRLCRREPPAQRRVAGRIRGPAGDPRLPRLARRGGIARICLIPESAHGTNPASAQMAGLRRRRHEVRRRRQRRPGRPARPSAKGFMPRTWRAVMITYPSTYGVFDTPRAAKCAALVHSLRRARLPGRREHERARRRRCAGRVRRRREPPEPAQDVLHSARRRRSRRRAGMRRGRPRAVPAERTAATRRRTASRPMCVAVGARVRGPAGQCGRAADQLDVPAHDGRRRACARRPRSRSSNANYVAARLTDHVRASTSAATSPASGAAASRTSASSTCGR